MGRLIGIDEAGYGPNLGPLVVAASVWEVVGKEGTGARGHGTGARGQGPGDKGCGVQRLKPFEQAPLDEIDLYELLDDVVTKTPASQSSLTVGEGDNFVPIGIADSKALYMPGGGLAILERGVLGALAAFGKRPTTWRELTADLGADPHKLIDKAAWNRGFDLDLPIDARCDDRQAVGSRLGSRENGAFLVAIRARAIFAAEFNALCSRHGNKAAALTHVSLELLGQVLADPPLRTLHSEFCTQTSRLPTADSPLPTLAVCDKHGGRNHYSSALQQQFPEWLVEVRGEGRAESQYVFGPANARIDVRFRKGGESFLPTALASMTAKYVRELAMRAFNDFWRRQLPGLKPTAGYPVDAKRFQSEIAEKQAELGIDDDLLWRIR